MRCTSSHRLCPRCRRWQCADPLRMPRAQVQKLISENEATKVFFEEQGIETAALEAELARLHSRLLALGGGSRRRDCHLMAPPIPLSGVSIGMNRGLSSK